MAAEPKNPIAGALYETLISPNESANIVDGLFAIARSLDRVARAIDRLGNADAATPMGGLEALGLAIKETGDRLALAIESQDD